MQGTKIGIVRGSKMAMTKMLPFRELEDQR
jgi:hypothetical protein